MKIDEKEKKFVLACWIMCLVLEALILASLSIRPGWTLAVFVTGLVISFGGGWAAKSGWLANESEDESRP